MVLLLKEKCGNFDNLLIAGAESESTVMPYRTHTEYHRADAVEEHALGGMSSDILHTVTGYRRRKRNGGYEEVATFTGYVDHETVRRLPGGQEVCSYHVVLTAGDGVHAEMDVPVEEWGTAGMMKSIKFAGPSFRTRFSPRDLGNALLDDSYGRFQRRYIYHGFGYTPPEIFLAPSGAILKGGRDDPNLVVVPVDEQNAKYLDLFHPSTESEPLELVQIVLGDLLNLQDRAVTLPLLGTVGLAVIHKHLPVSGYPTVACVGPSGSGKTSLCRAVQRFFGAFPVEGGLASFASTPAHLERGMHLFSNAVYVIDDHKRSTIGSNVGEYRRLVQIATDRTGRGRLTGAGASRSANIPRCIAILTGEDLLDGEAATVARQVIFPFEKHDRDNERMRRVEERGSRFSVLTRICVEHIQRMEDTVEIGAVFRLYQADIHAVLDRDPNRERIASHFAQVATGLHFLITSWSEAGLIPRADAELFIEEGVLSLEARAVEQLNLVHEEDVVAVFVQCLRDLIDTGKVRVVRPQDRHGVSNLVGFDLGDDDPDQLIYLIPDVAYRAVDRFRAGLGKALGLSQRSLVKALRERGFTVCNHGNFYEKRLPGMAKRSYLALPKTV